MKRSRYWVYLSKTVKDGIDESGPEGTIIYLTFGIRLSGNVAGRGLR